MRTLLIAAMLMLSGCATAGNRAFWQGMNGTYRPAPRPGPRSYMPFTYNYRCAFCGKQISSHQMLYETPFHLNQYGYTCNGYLMRDY